MKSIVVKLMIVGLLVAVLVTVSLLVMPLPGILPAGGEPA